MIWTKVNLLLVVFFAATFSGTVSSENLLLSEKFDVTTLVKHTNNLFIDVDKKVTPGAVLSTFLSAEQHNKLPAFSDQEVWRFYTINTTFPRDTAHNFWLTKSNSVIDVFDIYLLDSQGTVLSTEALGTADKALYSKPASLRQSSLLALEGQRQYFLLIKQFSTAPQAVEITLHSDNSHNSYLSGQLVLHSVFATILGALFVFNIVLFGAYPDRTYFWFLNFHLGLFIYFSTLYGFGHSFWPDTFMQWASTNIMVINYLLLIILFEFATPFSRFV